MSTFRLNAGPSSAWAHEGPVHAIKICSYKRVSLLLRLEALFPWCHPSPQVVRIRLFPAPPHRGSTNPGERHLMKTSHVGLGVPRFLSACPSALTSNWDESHIPVIHFRVKSQSHGRSLKLQSIPSVTEIPASIRGQSSPFFLPWSLKTTEPFPDSKELT